MNPVVLGLIHYSNHYPLVLPAHNWQAVKDHESRHFFDVMLIIRHHFQCYLEVTSSCQWDSLASTQNSVVKTLYFNSVFFKKVLNGC